MKKILLIIVLAFGGVCVVNGSSSKSDSLENLNIPGCTYGQCSATAKSTGEQCRNCCQQGSNFCWSHR